MITTNIKYVSKNYNKLYSSTYFSFIFFAKKLLLYLKNKYILDFVEKDNFYKLLDIISSSKQPYRHNF